MFLDILNVILDVIDNVIDSFKVPLFSVGSVSVSFWSLLLGLFIVGLIFSFFLRSRSGAAIDSVRTIKEKRSSH